MTARCLLLAALTFVTATRAFAAPPAATLAIRLYDYTNATDRQLRGAQEHVSDTFARIGIDTEWHPTLRPLDRRIDAADSKGPDDATLVVTLITSRMADRVRLPASVTGYAASAGNGIGHVAFVVADRAERLALNGGIAPDLVLGGVMAHELAHLLLPGRPHSRTGLMRSRWMPRDFLDLQRHAFADEEVVLIRHSVAYLSRESTVRIAD